MKNKIIVIATILIIVILSIVLKFNNNNNNSEFTNLKEITYKEILKKQDNKEDFILIISRSNCSHCNTYKPKVDEIARKHNLTIYYINTDTLSNKEEFKEEFKLNNATPLTLFFKNGKETTILNRIEGDLSTKTVENQFEKMGFIN